MAASDVWDYIFGSYVNAESRCYTSRRCYCDSKIEWLRYEATILRGNATRPSSTRETERESERERQNRRAKGGGERKGENEGTDRCALALGDNIAKCSRRMRHHVGMNR